MIPILFAANETAFTSNGIGRLTDAVSCEVTEERNGQYELAMQYPVDGEMFAEIACGKYIYATHDESKTPQAFKIYRISAPLEGLVTINAWHISYALNTIIVEPFTAGSCTAAIAGVKTHSMNTNPFTFSTDKQVTADFELTVPASVRAVLGGMSGSILDVYGTGEYEFDMYTVKLYLNRGQNRGVSIRYGKNLTKLDQTLDASNVYNSVVPYWTNGETTVVSDTIITRTGESVGNTVALDLSSDFTDAPTLVELKAKAQTIVDASDNYTLKENVKVDFVALWQTEEYKNFAALERVFLCDTVNIFYEKLGVNVTAKVIKVVYDTLRERYTSIELGEPTTSLYQQIQTAVVGDVLEVVPSKSQMQSAIEHATELIGGGFGGYIKFNYLSDGTPSEMLVMDSPDEATAINIIKLNQNGLGFSTDGGSTYANAWTIDGNLNASFITTGVLDADLMTAGMIQDASGKNYWNLDTGQFVTQQGQIADFIIDQTSLRSGTVGKGTAGTAITDGTWESTKTGTISGSGYTYQYTIKTKISNGGIELYASRDDVDADLVQVLKIEPHVWYVNGTARHNVYFSTSAADGYLFSINKSTEVGATDYPFIVHKRTEFLEGLKLDKDVQIGTDLTNANLEINGNLVVDGTGIAGIAVEHGTANKESAIEVKRTDANRNIVLMVGAGGINRGLYIKDGNMDSWLMYYDDTNINFVKPVSPTNLPVASTSQAGIVTTGAQTFQGAKTFNKAITTQDTSSNGAALAMRFTDKGNAEVSTIYTSLSNYGGRLNLREYSGNSSGILSYYELYQLPAPDSGRTGNATYSILTTKGNKVGTFTAGSGVSANIASVVKQTNNIVVVALYGTMPTGTGQITLGTVSGVTLPSDNLRSICGVGTHNYDTEGFAYCILDTSGVVKITKTVSAYTAFNVNFVYYVN